MTNDKHHELLLGDRFGPITNEVGFVEADCETVVAEWLKWNEELPGQAELGVYSEDREVKGDLEALLCHLPPLTAGWITRHLFVPTASSWTAIFNNARRGTDMSSAPAGLASRLRCRGLRVVAVLHTIRMEGPRERGRYGAVMLEVHGPDVEWFRGPSTLPWNGKEFAAAKLTRAIVAMNDGGPWRFFLEGEPLPFEQTERYRARRIRDRFTITMLRDYLLALGIRAFDADFYAPARRGILIKLVGATPLVEETLAEARAHF